ncbi:hypothetical protein D3C78_1797350 [compost metagenome]
MLPHANPKEPGALKLTLHRSGNRSIYGMLKVSHVSPGGAVQEIGQSPSQAVYTGLDRRMTYVPLSVPASALKQGRLRVTFTETLAPGKHADKPLATTELALP